MKIIMPFDIHFIWFPGPEENWLLIFNWQIIHRVSMDFQTLEKEELYFYFYPN
jgi:hypothetical protein